MKKKKDKETQPIPFDDVDVVRKTMGWHTEQIAGLYKQLGPPKDFRGMIGGTNEDGDLVFLIFKGNKKDIFNIKDFLEREDAEA